MNRQEAREFMMTVLFQMDAQNDFDVDNIDHYFDGKKLGRNKEYCQEIHSLACNKIQEVDDLISKFSKKWSIKRTPKADLAILRLAVIEIKYMDEIHSSVAINEAVELAKKYGEDNSSSYINGILSSVEKDKD